MWYQNNKDKAYERATIWRKENPDKVKAAQKRYRDKNPNKKRDERLKREFGITFEIYSQMFNEQNGVCKICEKTESVVTKKGKVKDLSVDHCHKTGQIRGLLCQKCNTAIGLLDEDLKIINNCVNYLTKREI